MQESDNNEQPDPVPQPGPADDESLFSSLALLANDSQLYAGGLAATVSGESRLNAKLLSSVLASLVVEAVGWILAWALLLGAAGYTAFVISSSGWVALGAVVVLHLSTLLAMAWRRRRWQSKVGFSRTKQLLMGISP